MAVSENDLVVGPLTPAAGVTTISLDYYFEQASWLEVYKTGSETPLVLNTDYTVTGAGTGSGVVTLTTAANGTDAYSVYLVVPLQRSSDMQLRGEFKSEPFNIEMDRLWQALQSVNTQVGRSVRLPKASTAIAPLLPVKSTGYALAWGEDGNLVNAPINVGDIANDLIAAQVARAGAEAAQEAAENVNIDVDDALAAAGEARDKAQQWAEEAEDVEVEAGAYSAKHHSAKSDAARVGSVAAQVAAETARDAAFVNADVYADIATGRAAVADGEQFMVVEGDEIVRYRRDSSSTQTEVARMYSSDGVDNRLRSTEQAVSDVERIGHPDVPGTTGGLTASPANFVIANPAVATGSIRSVTLFADNVGTLEISTWSKSGDTFTKVAAQVVTVVTGLQTVEISVPVVAGQRVGFCSSAVNIVSYTNTFLADDGGWYAGGAYGSASFVDASVSTTGRLYIAFDIWFDHDKTLPEVDAEQEAVSARVTQIEARRVASQSKNLVDPLIDQIELNQYVIPSSGTRGPIAGDRYATIGAFPVEAGKKYRLDLTNALDEWRVYQHPSAAFFFYDAELMSNVNLVSSHLSGDGVVEILPGGRVILFTAPAGATHCGCTVYGFSRAVTVAEFEQMPTALYMVEGWDEVPLEAQERADGDVPHDVVAQRSGAYWYVRTPHRTGDDAVFRVNVDYDPGANTNGVIDFDGIRLIPSVTPYASTKAAFDASAVVLNNGGDASPPHNMNGVFLGGGHGMPVMKVTYAAHGKTNVDVGSTYTDGLPWDWVIVGVVDSNNLLMMPVNAGTATSWSLTRLITGNLTHKTGGTNTADILPSATVQTQLWPNVQQYRVRAVMDGDTTLYDDGVYFGSEFKLIEEYGIPNIASLLDALVADVGSTDAPDYTRADVATQVQVQTTYAWDFSGICEVNHTTVDLQSYTVGYHGGMQMQKMIADTGESLFLHVPRCTTLTLATGADTSTFTATVDVVDEDWTDPANPPDRFFQILKRGSEKRHGFIQGYSKNAGIDRTALNSAFFTPHTSLKMYPRAVDPGMGATAVAGTLREAVGFFGPFDPNRDQDFNAKVLFPDVGAHSLYLQATAGVTNKWVALPERLIGEPVTVTFASGINCASTVVSTRGVLVNSATGGELEIRIGD